MADEIPEQADRVSVPRIDIVAVARGFVVGLGGALAGLTAIIYACGYLVTRAHLSLLGLYGLIDFNHDFIMQEGAKFFLVMAYSVGREMVLPALSNLTILASLLIALGLWLRVRVQRWWDALQRRIPGQPARRLIRVVAFVAAFSLFLVHSDEYLDKFEHPLCFANLLYIDGGIANCAAARDGDGLRRALLMSDRATLNLAYRELVIGLAQSLVIAWFTWRVTRPWRWHVWCIAPCFFATGLYVILLPMDYGVLKRTINYPRIALTVDEKVPFSMSGPVFLLNKSPNDFVVWAASTRQLYWVPAASVRRAEVDGAYDLFDPRWDRTATHGEKK